MRKLPFLLILLVASLLLLAAAASAHAVSLPVVGQPPLLAGAAGDDEAGEEEAGDGEEAEEDGQGEDCSGAEVEEELCEEEGEDEETEDCLLEEANASVVAVAGNDLVRLAVHYRSSEPTAVNVDARLRGTKGGLHLGSERVRFHRAGTYRDSFSLGPKQMPKALAAREFEIDLRAVGAPADCRLDLATRGSRRAR